MEHVNMELEEKIEEINGLIEAKNGVKTEINGKKSCKIRERIYWCTYCPENFRRKDALDRHMYHHTNEKKYICSFVNCQKSYTNVSHLRRHTKTFHSEEKHPVKISCKDETCKDTFTSRSNMERHFKRIHIKRELYTCDICEERFRQKQQLRRHYMIHTGNFPYQCECCGKGFGDMVSHRRHRAAHTHECEQCGRKYKHWSGLVAHRKIAHTIEYRCTECNKLFHSKRNLKYHQKVHSNKDDRLLMECPYEMCSKYYFEKRNLDAHIRSKHEGRNFICGFDDCGRKISTKQKLIHHLKLHLSEKDGVKSRQSSRRNSLVDVERKPRKDKGTKNQAAAVLLSGVIVPTDVEKLLIKNQGDQISIPDEYLPVEVSETSDVDLN